MQTQAEYIIGRFGGLTATAKAIGRATTVVQGWKERGTIPASRHLELLEAGIALSPPLERREFIEDTNGQAHSHLRRGPDLVEPEKAA